MKSVVTASAILFTQQNPKKDGTYPVKLRVTFNRVRKYYRLQDLSFTIEEFERISGKAPKGDNLKFKQMLKSIESQALEVINRLNPFTFEAFEDGLFGRETKSETNFYKRCMNYIAELKSKDRFGSAESYSSTLKAFQNFSKKKDLHLAQITPKFLDEFERYMTDNGKSLNTVGIYLRNARKIFNDAIAEGAFEKSAYPFGKKRYSIPQTEGNNRPLTKIEIKQIFDYQTEPYSIADYAKDLFIFSYLCNGMNFSDMLRLKNKAIESDRFTFVREKTKGTSKTNQKKIEVLLHPETRRIIEKYAEHSEEYVFPFLKTNQTEAQQRQTIHQTVKNTNKYLRKFAQELGIQKDVTTYFARHTFATVTMQAGASREFIQQSLGHADPKTTENYLGSFDYETKKKFTDELL